MNLKLDGRSVAITGGTAGIGKAIALAFLKENCKVAICSRVDANVRQTVKEFADMGYRVYGEAADVTDYKAIKRFADNTAEQYGKIDVWINNAGNAYSKMITDFEIDEWKNAIDLNMNSVFFAAKAVAPIMRKNGGGVILNTASYAGILPQIKRGCYAAAKSGVMSLTRSLAGELAPFGIRVAAIAPGPIYSRMTEEDFRKDSDRAKRPLALQRIGTAEEIASWAVFMASDAASFFTGSHVELSGGKYCVQDPIAAWEYYADEAGK